MEKVVRKFTLRSIVFSQFAKFPLSPKWLSVCLNERMTASGGFCTTPDMIRPLAMEGWTDGRILTQFLLCCANRIMRVLSPIITFWCCIQTTPDSRLPFRQRQQQCSNRCIIDAKKDNPTSNKCWDGSCISWRRRVHLTAFCSYGWFRHRVSSNFRGVLFRAVVLHYINCFKELHFLPRLDA